MSSTLEKKQAATQLSGSRISPLAGKPAPREMLVDLPRLEKEYFDRKPDLEDANQFVVLGTSGHRGTSLNGTFTEAQVLAITQAICDYRKALGITGTLSLPAQYSAREVLAANNVDSGWLAARPSGTETSTRSMLNLQKPVTSECDH
jgi:phosphoglucomutase